MSKLSVIAFVALVANTNCGAIAASMPVAFSADFSVGSNSTQDPLLSAGAIAGAVLARLRESGVAAQENPPEADVGISLDVCVVYNPQVLTATVTALRLCLRPSGRHFLPFDGSPIIRF